ncbi:recombinase family protein [Pseudophaeobacter sp. A-200-2]|uniref:recombinase family protein n=1 Tax=Pseudophaeobacter sp. A-200-2 TaxID=3098145 RepID=UPI0034D4A7E5
MAQAFSYLRISSEKQTRGGGIARQIEASARYAAEHGYELVETLQDVGVSAYHGKNAIEGALGTFLEAIDSGAVEPGSVLIVESLDRLSRQDPMAAFTQFSQIISKGISIVTLVDNQVYSPETVKTDVSKLFLSLGSMMRAHDESRTKSLRQTSAWKQKRASGKVMTELAPAWLTVVDGQFVVKEGAAELINEIFQKCINGMGFSRITKTFNSDHDRFPPFAGDKWTPSYVGKILKTRHVLGELQPYSGVGKDRAPVGEPIKGYYPQIVTEDVYLLAQAALAGRKNSGGRKGASYTNLFSGLIKCGKCGAAMIYRARGNGAKGRDHLRCNNSYKGNGCDGTGWLYHEFEDVFYEFVKEISFLEVFKGGDVESKKTLLSKNAVVLNEKIAETERQILAIIDRMTVAELSETLISAMAKKEKELQLELKDLRKKAKDNEDELSGLKAENVQAAQKDFIEKYEQVTDKQELAEVRFHMASILRNTMSKIECFNGFKVYPWETDQLSPAFRAAAAEKGNKTDRELETFLDKWTGQLLYDKSERYFVVTFKNGVQRTAFPFEEATYLNVSERMAAMMKKGRNCPTTLTTMGSSNAS